MKAKEIFATYPDPQKKELESYVEMAWEVQFYYSDYRRLWPCKLTFYSDNIRYLECKYKRMSTGNDDEEVKDDKKGKPGENAKSPDDDYIIEYYDFLKICVIDGMITGRGAFQRLNKDYGLKPEFQDIRVTPYNVLRMKANKFERIFVFVKGA